MSSQIDEASEKEDLAVMHGLPGNVVFCGKCVISNQRPVSSPEFRKKSITDTETTAFGDDGICDACKYAEYKKTIDWAERERQLREVCDRYRRDDGRYDVIVPGSGGKDSIFVSHLLKTKYNMNPLIVTWAPHAYTDIGWRNVQAWQQIGFAHSLFTPDPKVHGTLTRLAFVNLLNPFQPFILGQKILGPRMARMFGVPFVMYGENQAEVHNRFADAENPIMDPSHYTCGSREEPLYFGGVEMRDLGSHGIKSGDMQPYLPLLREEAEKAEIKIHFMSHYVHWSPQQNFYYAKENSDFETNADRSEGTYSKYASLDDKVDGQFYFTSLIKFGQGRAARDAVRDIRDGYIGREEGVVLANKYDGEFPRRHFEFFLDYIGIDEDRYWEIVDRNRSPHLWRKSGNEWILRHPTR